MPEPEPMTDKEVNDLWLPGCPLKTFISNRTLQRALALARQEKARADEEEKIVSRIWDIYGNPSFESLQGKSLYDLIRSDRARAERLDDQLLMLTDQCKRIEFRAKEAEDELRATSKLMEANKRIEDAFAARVLALEARAEKERDEAISEDANFWEKKTAKAEARLAAAEELANAARKFCHNNDLRFCTSEAGDLRAAIRTFEEVGK